MFEQVKEIAAQWLGPLYGPLVLVGYALFPFLGPHILNGIFILSAVICAVYFYLYGIKRDTPATASDFFRFLLPRKVFLHRSALVDYRFYVINSVLLSYAKLSMRVAGFVGLLYISDGVQYVGTALFGAAPAAGEPSWILLVSYTLAMALAVDFAKFLAHFLQHKVKLLWEFHKVHHSAEVMTPITNYRLHPVDVMLEQLLAATLVGTVAGVFSWFHPHELAEPTILNIGIIYFVYFLAANLRHSHIPLAFGWRTSHVLSSPYMHQIHHSSEVRHWDKNFALIFSFWDWLFNSLYVPRGKEEFRLGLPGTENERFNSVLKLYVAPFVGAAKLLSGRKTPQPQVPQPIGTSAPRLERE